MLIYYFFLDLPSLLTLLGTCSFISFWKKFHPAHLFRPAHLLKFSCAWPRVRWKKPINSKASICLCGNTLYMILERALRALASSSGGAACPGATRGQPRGSTPGVRGWFQGDLSEKKILWRKPNEQTDRWTHRRDSQNSYVDMYQLFYYKYCSEIFLDHSIISTFQMHYRL